MHPADCSPLHVQTETEVEVVVADVVVVVAGSLLLPPQLESDGCARDTTSHTHPCMCHSRASSLGHSGH